MPLLGGYSKQTVSDNIAIQMEEGKPQKQAVAMSLSNARKEFRKKYPGKPYPRHLQTKPKANTMKKRRTAAQKRATAKMQAGLKKWRKSQGIKTKRKTSTRKATRRKTNTSKKSYKLGHTNYYVAKARKTAGRYSYWNGAFFVKEMKKAAVWHDKATAKKVAARLADEFRQGMAVIGETKKH